MSHFRDVMLVSCVSLKKSQSVKGKDLYISSWFKKARKYAERHADSWYILSAKYHLLHPEAVAEPYNLTLNHMKQRELREWARITLEMLKEELYSGDTMIILAGMNYRRFLLDGLRDMCREIVIPMEGLGIGKQLQWLDRNT